MDESIRKHLEKLKRLTPALEKKIREYGVVTGSKVFGGATDDSDRDWIIHPDFNINWIFGYAHHRWSEDYNDGDFFSYYVMTEGGEIWNLLLMKTEKEEEIWRTATRCLRRLVNSEPMVESAMKNKDSRVAMFEAIKDILKGYGHTYGKVSDR